MADRMDDEHSAPVGGLSIWVGLATFFSNSSERSRAHEAVKQAKEASRRKEEEEKTGLAGSDNGSGSVVGLKKKKGKRFGSWFGSKKDKTGEAAVVAGTGTDTSTAV